MSRYARDERRGENGRDDSRGKSPNSGDDSRGRLSTVSNENRRSPLEEIQEAPMPGAWKAAEESKVPSWDLLSLLPEPRCEGWSPPTPPRVHLEQGLGQFKDTFEDEIPCPPRFKITDKETILRENEDIEEREPLVILSNLCIVRTDLRGIKDSKRKREMEDVEEERVFRNTLFVGRGGQSRGRGRHDSGGDPNRMPVGERRSFTRDCDRGSAERSRRPPSPMEHRPPKDRMKNENSKHDGEESGHGHSSKTVKSQSPRGRMPRSPLELPRPLSPPRGGGERRDSSSRSNTSGRMSSCGRGPGSLPTSSATSGAGSPAGGTPLTYKEYRERKEREKATGQ